jgi:ATP-dependent Clp protease ATP-binding subunit ClpC
LEKVIEVEEIDAVDREAIASEVEVLAATLERLNLEAATLRRRLRGLTGVGDTNHHGRPVSRTPECKDAFRRAKEVAGGSITALALLVSLLERSDDAIRAALGKSDVSPAMLRDELLKIDLREVGAGNEKTSTPTLDQFGRDLTRLAVSGKLGPVIGRRHELLLLLQTLARRSKNNPVLVGDAGVGKTAIVEALAIRAAAGKDKAVLDGKRIVELNMGALLAGTKYRGEFEKRLTHILSEVKRNPNVVIFIDEIHTVMGAGGGSDQPLDAANMLKPALARGELRCIGATTPAEYRRHIEADPALERRFEKVLVGEPTREETLEILRGLKPKWEEHHQVRILDESLEAAVDLSLRFDTEHRLPDKAIDLVDKAAARTRVPILSAMAPEEGGPITSGGSVYGDVTSEAVAYVLAEKRGIPPDRVMEGLEGSSASRLLELESFLEKRLIGQAEAVHRVAQRLRLAHSGMKTRRGPMAVFLFLGPTGVGKTEMARLLAEFLFGSSSELVRFDMSEYMEEHSVSKLIGAPPGYVGHDTEGQLSLHLNRRPYSVVLLDEIEKAHARIFDLFLQVFDEGRLTDSKGRTADARHVVFVMTSNLGVGKEPLGFGAGEEESIRVELILEEAQRWFRPELWNRIDEVVCFRPLAETDTIRILRPWIQAIGEKLREQHGVSLTVTPAAEAFIARAGYSPSLGARELQRTLERLLQVPLSDLILSGKIKRHKDWKLVYEEGGVYLLPGTA